MSDALETIEEYFQEFRDGIVRCEAALQFNRADLLDAQNRLARLRDRYIAEKDDLSLFERKALSKVFEKDVFIQGMLNVRQIGEHVTKRSGGAVILRTPANAPIELDCQTSAMSYFGASRVLVGDAKGQKHQVDHFEQLKEAESRISAALRKARE